MRLEHRFVEFIPKNPDDNVIYISIRFSTTVHNCACGCGIKTVTPLSPTDWKITFNGKSVSLYPSIGNWGFPCQSHYWITENCVEWASKWSKDRINKGRTHNKINKANYYIDQSNQTDKRWEPELKDKWWHFKWFFRKLLN